MTDVVVWIGFGLLVDQVVDSKLNWEFESVARCDEVWLDVIGCDEMCK